jgi:two-component system, cell cycle response regulator DivK
VIVILNGKFIFIVEDKPQNRLVFQMALNRHGAWVEYETSGEDILPHLMRLRRAHAIVLDLILPGNMSGYDVYDQIRALDAYKTVPIVAVTASDPSIAMPLVREKGFNSFIMKPIDINLFPQQLARIIEGEEIWSAVAR